MTAPKSSTQVSDAREKQNTSCEALMAASATLVASAAQATSASEDNHNGGSTAGPEVENRFPSDDPNAPLARTWHRIERDEMLPPGANLHFDAQFRRGEPKKYVQHNQKMQQLPEPTREAPRDAVDKRNPDAPGGYQQTPGGVAAAGEATAVAAAAQRAPVGQDPSPVPKWIRVGKRVCFSTVVSAVLIPSAEDISATAKRELWWQPEDFYEFRLNHARRQAAGKRADDVDDDENLQRSTPVATATDFPAAALDAGSGPEVTSTTVAVNASNNSNVTATVEGVLVVAASPVPAPAAIASRSASCAMTDMGADVNDYGRNDPRISGLDKRSTMTAVERERARKWTPRMEDGRTDRLEHTRRVTDNRGGASGSGIQSGHTRRGRGNHSPSVRYPVGRQSRRSNGGEQSPSFRNDVPRWSHESGQVYGGRNWSTSSGSNFYAPPMSHGHSFVHRTAAGHGTIEPYVVGQYPRQLPVRGPTGPMLPPSVYPGPMACPQDAKPQFSMWRSPVFAPIILQCARENIVA